MSLSFSVFSLLLTHIQCADLPNFVMVMVDDMGWGDVSYNGGTAYTPNIDDLRNAPHTITFQRGYSGSPLCSPTRSSFLTGRNGDRECIYSANPAHGSAWEVSMTLPLPTSTFTIAEAVKKADSSYQTAFFGKWHLGDFWDKGDGNDASNPGMHGFDYWLATEGNAATATPNCGCAAFNDTDTCVLGHFENADSFCRTYWYGNDSDSNGVMNISYMVDRYYNNDTDNERDTYFMVTKFEEWLQDMANLTQPMLVLLWFHAPHAPEAETEEIRNGCANGTYCKDGTYASSKLDYWGCIWDIDTQVGRLRSLLIDYDIYDNTLFWFSSDNGPESGHGGTTGGLRGVKNDVWEGGIRVPTIIEWPAVIPNDSFVSEYPVVTHDILPTIMDVLNIESDTPDWELDGISIMDVLRDGTGDNMTRSKAIGFTYLGDGLSLAYMDDDWKIVQNSNHCEDDECDAALYNLKDDPWELNDLSSVYSSRFESMQDDMNDWYGTVLKSQISDTGCLFDRASSYSEYVIIGIVAGVVACCCLICLIGFAFKLGWVTLGIGCWCCAKIVDDVTDEVEMAENAQKHEKTDKELQTADDNDVTNDEVQS